MPNPALLLYKNNSSLTFIVMHLLGLAKEFGFQAASLPATCQLYTNQKQLRSQSVHNALLCMRLLLVSNVTQSFTLSNFSASE